MDRGPFPPSILALAKGVGIVLSVAFGSIKTVEYGIRTYEHFDLPTQTIFGIPPQTPVAFSSDDSGHCDTCQFVDLNNRPLDYYGRPLRLDELPTQKPDFSDAKDSRLSSTFTLTAPSTLNPTGASSTPSTPNMTQHSIPMPTQPLPDVLASGHSTFEDFLSLIELSLGWWITPFDNYVMSAISATVPRSMIPGFSKLTWLILYRLTRTFVEKIVVAWFRYVWSLIKTRKIKRTRVGLRKTHKDELDETYERDVAAATKRAMSAAANFEPNFGPSLQNAEVELRGQLDKVELEEGMREDIVSIFKKVLYSFTYAMAVHESMPGGLNTRYLSIIEAQKTLIESLRLLLVYREHAFAENEDLVRLLCRYDNHGKLIIPDERKDLPPWQQYSVEDDRFLVSPPDGPTALSMKVSISAVPFETGPSCILDSDPYWKRFLDSIAERRADQELRLVSGRERCNDESLKNASQQDPGVARSDEEISAKHGEKREESGTRDTVGHCDSYNSQDQKMHLSKQLPQASDIYSNLAPYESPIDRMRNSDSQPFASTIPDQEGTTPLSFNFRSDSDLESDPRWHAYLTTMSEAHAKSSQHTPPIQQENTEAEAQSLTPTQKAPWSASVLKRRKKLYRSRWQWNFEYGPRVRRAFLHSTQQHLSNVCNARNICSRCP